MHAHTNQALLLLCLLVSTVTPLWADRDDRDDKRRSFERKLAQRDEINEPRAPQPARPAAPVREQPAQPRVQEPPREHRAPADGVRQPRPVPVTVPGRDDKRQSQPVRPPEATREQRPQPEKPRTYEPAPVRRAQPEQPRPADNIRHPQPAPGKDWRAQPAPPKQPPKPGYVVDTRHRHNHYYPPKRRVITHNHTHYHYHHGVWYRPYNSHFIVVLPPFGIRVPVLPPFYSVVRLSSTTTYYYYAGGVYYDWLPVERSYVVVEAPPEDKLEVVSTNNGTDELFIYPKMGQDEDQQARDRYDCHSWARSETGYDPSLPGGGVPESQHADKRADYFRAMKACLEARHYSVQ
jgi:hypothetical protein